MERTKEIFEYPAIMSPKHIKEYVGCSLAVVYEMFRLNDFPSLDIPGPKRILRDDFEKWIKNRRKGA